MTPEERESRRIAEELARRERRSPGSDAPLDPATFAVLFEKILRVPPGGRRYGSWTVSSSARRALPLKRRSG